MLAVNTPIELHLSINTHLRTSATMPLAPYMENPTTSMTAPAEPKKLKKLKKLIKIPSAILGVWPAYQGISKLADSEREKYVVPAKRILKSATISKLKAKLVDETKPLDLAFIGAVPFQYLARQKDIEIYAVSMQDIKNELNVISMKNIKYQLNKIAKIPTDPKTVVPKEYHKFLEIFLKKASDTLSPHSKYGYQIHLLKGYRDYGNNSLSKILEPKLQFVKKFLEEHLKRGFIEASSASCSLWIMLAVKLGGGIRFYIDYRCLNKLTKKDAYPIPLIEETVA